MRTKRSGVYHIVNEINGKSYIGSSSSIYKRWRQWRWYFKTANTNEKRHDSYNSPLTRAVLKYGVEHFTFIILEECEPVKETVEARENYYLDLVKPQYNILPNAYTNLGYKHTEEWKQNASVRSQEFMNRPENKQKYSELRKGKTFEEIFGDDAKEILIKQSKGRTGKGIGLEPHNKGIPMTEEQKAPLSAMRKRAMTDEIRKKISQANKGNIAWNKETPWSDEMKQKLSEAHIGQVAWNKGIPATVEERQRLSEISQITRTPEHQQKMTEAARIVNTGKHHSEQTRQRISEATKGKDMSMLRGIPRTEQVKQKVSEGIKASETFQESVKARFGKSTKKDGTYGIIFDKSRNKYQVRIQGKMHGRFVTKEDAIIKRDEILNSINM